jgi:arylsulfatase A-like enzyme
MIHIPWVILENKNVSTPATTADFLPTIMGIFQVESDNPTWTMDGIDLVPLVQVRNQMFQNPP